MSSDSENHSSSESFADSLEGADTIEDEEVIVYGHYTLVLLSN